MNTTEALNFLKHRGCFVRKATLQEKRDAARRAKHRFGLCGLYARHNDNCVRNEFRKPTFIIFRGSHFWGIYSARELIKLARDFNLRSWNKDKKKAAARISRNTGKRIVVQCLADQDDEPGVYKKQVNDWDYD